MVEIARTGRRPAETQAARPDRGPLTRIVHNGCRGVLPALTSVRCSQTDARAIAVLSCRRSLPRRRRVVRPTTVRSAAQRQRQRSTLWPRRGHRTRLRCALPRLLTAHDAGGWRVGGRGQDVPYPLCGMVLVRNPAKCAPGYGRARPASPAGRDAAPPCGGMWPPLAVANLVAQVGDILLELANVVLQAGHQIGRVAAGGLLLIRGLRLPGAEQAVTRSGTRRASPCTSPLESRRVDVTSSVPVCDDANGIGACRTGQNRRSRRRKGSGIIRAARAERHGRHAGVPDHVDQSGGQRNKPGRWPPEAGTSIRRPRGPGFGFRESLDG